MVLYKREMLEPIYTLTGQLSGGRTTTVRSRARLQKRQPEARAQLVCCDRARLVWRVAAVSGRDRFQILSLSGSLVDQPLGEDPPVVVVGGVDHEEDLGGVRIFTPPPEGQSQLWLPFSHEPGALQHQSCD